MIIRTPAQRWIRLLSLSRGMNMMIIAMSVPMNAPIAAGDVRRL